MSGSRTSAGRRPPRLARLRAVHPPELRWQIVCGSQPLTVGSVAAASQQGLDAPGVAQRHFTVRYEAAHRRHVGRDLGSPTGTRIDGIASGEAMTPLRDGAVLRLGDVCLVYEVIETHRPHDRPGQEPASTTLEAVPGRAPAIESLRLDLPRAATDDAPVLLEGESGTGKRRVVRELHRLGARTGSLVVIECSHLTPGRLETEIGTSTGATVVLDEIGELEPMLQTELLRVSRAQHDVRVIATTRRPLVHGDLRPDMMTHLSTWRLHIVPLRRRRGDILEWLHALAPSKLPTLSPEAVETILLASWADNLHGLKRLAKEIAALPDGVRCDDLPTWAGPRHAAPKARGVPSTTEFAAAFERLDGNVSALARHFSRNRRQIYRWIERGGLGRGLDPK
jgi:DNA-binding NtrC family response regulator